ncbi:MAG: PEP/pyruvate-binding domain-containing protein, partial [bacterium]
MKNSGGSMFMSWEETFEAGVTLSGGKGWNLARLDRYGFPVPAGGVLAARAYDQFVRHNRMEGSLEAAAREADGLDPADTRQWELSEEIRRLHLSGEIPRHLTEEIRSRLSDWGLSGASLAVRSSAAAEDSASASFAGIHDSFLNVRGEEQLLAAVRACWASAWNQRAVAYRRGMGLSGEPPAQAVVIMAMVEPGASGVAFSCHPGRGREDQVFISANFGLGEAVVG